MANLIVFETVHFGSKTAKKRLQLGQNWGNLGLALAKDYFLWYLI